MVGLIINFIKYTQYFNIITESYICNDIDDAKKKLIDYLINQFQYLKIDFPLNLEDFEYIWFKNEYINTNVFTYKIFINNKWEEPWELQDIYTDLLDILQNIENEKILDLSEIYGEPNPDEYKEDNFSINNSEETCELKNIMNKIINDSKNINQKNDFVKECKCIKCQNN